MESLKTDRPNNSDFQYSTNWFMDNLERQALPIFKIGIVAMDLVKDTVKSSDVESADERWDRITAKLLMLFCRLSKIHLDLSLTNVLFTKTEAYVIDYGRLFLFENLFDNVPDTTPVDMHGRFTKGAFFARYNAFQAESHKHYVFSTNLTKFLHNSYKTVSGTEVVLAVDTKKLTTLVDHLKFIQLALLTETYSNGEKIEMIKQIIYFMNITDYIYNRGSRQQNRIFDFLSPGRYVNVGNLNKRFGNILEQFKSISQTCGQIDNDSKVCEVNEYCDEPTGICYYTHILKNFFRWPRGGRKKSIKLRRHVRYNKTHTVGRKSFGRKRSRRRGD